MVASRTVSQVVPSGILQEFVWWTRRHFRQPLFCFTFSHFSSTVAFGTQDIRKLNALLCNPVGIFHPGLVHCRWPYCQNGVLLNCRDNYCLFWCAIVNVLLCLANQSNLKHFPLYSDLQINYQEFFTPCAIFLLGHTCSDQKDFFVNAFLGLFLVKPFVFVLIVLIHEIFTFALPSCVRFSFSVPCWHW